MTDKQVAAAERAAKEVMSSFPWLERVPVPDLMGNVPRFAWDLLGNWDGRLWQITVNPGLGWPYRFEEGYFAARCSFRGAPPGSESERVMPWLFLGPWSNPPGGFSEVQGVQAIIRRDRPGELPRSKEDRARIAAFASHPTMQNKLRSADWMVTYQALAAGAVQGRFVRQGFNPFIVGLLHRASVVLPLHDEVVVGRYAHAVQQLHDLAPLLEEGFEVPSIARVPMRFGAHPKPGLPFNFAVLYDCATCASSEPLEFLWDVNVVPFNVRCQKCRSVLFRDPPNIVPAPAVS
jgi:hypothetical protein